MSKEPNNISYIPKRPLICVEGEKRPAGIPHISEGCNEKVARSFYLIEAHWTNFRQMIDKFACRGGLTKNCERLGNFNGWYKNDHGNTTSIPASLKKYGSLGIKHPFMDIVYSLDHYGIEDYRSAEVFSKVADSEKMDNLIGDKRKLVFLYPASGSHMTPLLMPLELIDAGKLDSAEIIYTEIDKGAPKRIETYLKFHLSKGLIQNYRKRVIRHGNGKEFRFDFKYRGKKIRLTMKLNMGGDVYALNKDIRKSDVIIFHDGVMNSKFADGVVDVSRADVESNNIANKFIERLKKIGGDKKHLLITDDQWGCSTANSKTQCNVNQKIISGDHIAGFYGCSGKHYFGKGFLSGHAYRTVSIEENGHSTLTTKKGNLGFDCNPKDRDSIGCKDTVHAPSTLEAGALLFLL